MKHSLTTSADFQNQILSKPTDSVGDGTYSDGYKLPLCNHLTEKPCKPSVTSATTKINYSTTYK